LLDTGRGGVFLPSAFSTDLAAIEGARKHLPWVSALVLGVIVAGLSASVSKSQEQGALSLAKQKNCLACHSIDKKLVGPAYNDVAKKYKDYPGIADALATKVMQGEGGVWGAARMPANRVTHEEAHELVAWTLSLGEDEDAASKKSTPSQMDTRVAVKTASGAAPVLSKVVMQATPANVTALKRGEYLVNSIMACGNCHSGSAGKWGIPGEPLTGGRSYVTSRFKVTAGNLTSDVDTGLGGWTRDDFERVLTTGVRPDDIPIAPAMPWGYFKALTNEDLDAVASYLVTLPPIHKESPSPEYLAESPPDVVPDAERKFDPAQINQNPVERGRYLATLGHCLECHTPEVNGVADLVRNAGAGGKRLGPEHVLVPNITSDAASGLGSWSDNEVKRALTQGVSRDGHQLAYPMPWRYFATLNESDVDALVAWLRTLPAKQMPAAMK
jgi:cytochrome c551/c552